jgi:U2 small nuclear ribonucleoprotein A'
LLCSNNSISKFGDISNNIPNLHSLILTNNKISSFTDIEVLSGFRNLEHLSLIDNPIVAKLNYRMYIIFKIPCLKSLDFRKIRKTEREESAKYFKSVIGKAMLDDLLSEKHAKTQEIVELVLTNEQKEIVRQAILSATSKEEVELIEKRLKVRYIISLIFIFITFYH